MIITNITSRTKPDKKVMWHHSVGVYVYNFIQTVMLFIMIMQIFRKKEWKADIDPNGTHLLHLVFLHALIHNWFKSILKKHSYFFFSRDFYETFISQW